MPIQSASVALNHYNTTPVLIRHGKTGSTSRQTLLTSYPSLHNRSWLSRSYREGTDSIFSGASKEALRHILEGQPRLLKVGSSLTPTHLYVHLIHQSLSFFPFPPLPEVRSYTGKSSRCVSGENSHWNLSSYFFLFIPLKNT